MIGETKYCKPFFIIEVVQCKITFCFILFVFFFFLHLCFHKIRKILPYPITDAIKNVKIETVYISTLISTCTIIFFFYFNGTWYYYKYIARMSQKEKGGCWIFRATSMLHILEMRRYNKKCQ